MEGSSSGLGNTPSVGAGVDTDVDSSAGSNQLSHSAVGQTSGIANASRQDVSSNMPGPSNLSTLLPLYYDDAYCRVIT